MEITKAHSFNTTLRDRVLWYDGSVTVDPKQLQKAMSQCSRVLNVSHVDSTVLQYNKHVEKSEQLTVKTQCNPLDTSWDLPLFYKNLDVVQYIADIHASIYQGCDAADVDAREVRLARELILYDAMGLHDVLRAIIYIINNLHTNNVVWGVGRGSCVASYVLYVIGVHDIDSHLYNLDITDFLHE